MITIDKIDELGTLLAEIDALTAKAKAIKDAIKDEASLSGQRVWDGGKYEALFTATNVSTVDWKAVAKELSIPVELIAKHTKTSARYTVNCDPKKTK